MLESVNIDDPLLEPSPCDSCPLNTRCRDEQLACDQFQAFYLRGGTGWRLAPRQPSAEIYGKVFAPLVGRPRKPGRRRKVTAAIESAQRAARLNAFMLD